MSDRDALAELIRKAGQAARDADHANGYRCGFDPDRFMADYILAAGWRKTDEAGHNHWTPDVMPDGECPACDRIAQEVADGTLD